MANRAPKARVALLTCGAIAREVLGIIEKHQLDAEVLGVDARLHMRPGKIAPAVQKRYDEIHEQYDEVHILYGDCGSGGQVKALGQQLGVQHLVGPHCYEFYGGEEFQKLAEEEPGSYFLTDFLLRGFEGLVVKGMGLDRFPELKDDYFANYKRLVYLVQHEDPKLMQKAQAVADWLGLELIIRHTGYGLLEDRVLAMVRGEPQPPDTGVSAY